MKHGLLSVLFFCLVGQLVGQVVPPNDLCVDATEIPVGVGGTLNPDFCNNEDPISITVDLSNATAADNPNEVCGPIVFQGVPNPIPLEVTTGTEPGVWYKFTPPLGVVTPFIFVGNDPGLAIEITTCNPGTSFDTQIAVFEGNDCNNLTCITTNDDGFCTENGFTSKVNFSASSVNPTTFYIYLYGYQGATGTAQMTVSCNNYDDLCLAPVALAQLGETVTVDFTDASDIGIPKNTTCPTPLNSQGKWFRIPSFGITDVPGVDITISTCNPGTDFDAKIRVFKEPNDIMQFGPCGYHICVAESDNGSCNSNGSSVTFFGKNCSDYFVYVYSDDGNLGTAEISFTSLYTNDLCANATVLAVNEVGFGRTDLATADDAPVLCNNLNPNPGLWYTFIGTGEKLTLTSCLTGNIIQYNVFPCNIEGPEITADTRISVFEGSCGGPLNCIGVNDDFCGIQSSLTFCTELGTPYYAYVDGNTNQQGKFAVQLFEAAEELIISCPEDITVFVNPGEPGIVVDYELPEGIPTCPGLPAPTTQTNQTGGLGSGALFPLGTTTETFEVTQSNPAITKTCSFSVTVLKNPVIPTMSQWGLFVFGLIILTLGVVGVYNLKFRTG